MYLFVLLCFVCLYYAFAIQYITNTGYETFYASLAPQTPVITVKDGKVSTPENRPYFITDPDTHENIAVIDTTGQYKTNEQAKSIILITDTQFIVQKKEGETRIYTIPANFQALLDPQQINEMAHQFLSYLWIPFFFLILLCLYVYRILQALVYSIIGKIFASIYKVQITYSQIVQIMLIAITPAIIIAVVQHALSLSIPFDYLFYFLLAMGYLFYGIMANKT